MSEPKSNPYLDEALFNAAATFSPSENVKYLKDHGASQNTQQLAATTMTTTTTTLSSEQQQIPAPPQQYETYTNFHADSQETEIIDEEVVGVPFGDGNADKPPLLYQELETLKKGDLIWIQGDDDNYDDEAWQKVKFLRLESDGFVVETNKLMDSESGKYEEIFCPTMDDEDMPTIYSYDINKQKQETKTNGNDGDNKQKQEKIDYTISDFSYKTGSKIFVYDDANNFIPYTIESYDNNTTKATLKDNSNEFTELYLKNFKHETDENSESKAIPIEKKEDDIDIDNDANNINKTKKISRLGQYIDISTINGHWTWCQRTNSMKLKWISYKNTLLGTIAVATKHLYPISLDYKTLMFISGSGLGFHWLDIEEYDDDEDDDIDEEEEKKQELNQEDIIEEHMKLFLGDSNLDAVLNQIGKYSYYKFERHTISEILHSNDGIKRLMELEQIIVGGINNNICSITNDENGHLSLIVGYISKPTMAMSPAPTSYYFKIKKFGIYDGNKEEIEKEEYIAIDLYNQQFVITMEPPQKDKKYSLQHSFNPEMLLNIITDLISIYETELNMKQEIDLFGRNALCHFRDLMNKAKQTEVVSDKLAKLSIFALIRLFDSRKTSIEYIKYILAKIENAFHSQTGSEKEWKFPPKYDVSSELHSIESSLLTETSVIRRQQKIFEQYILSYNGKPLNNIKWETWDRAGIKAALDDIILNEDNIIHQLKKLKDKLNQYQLSLST